MGLRKKSPDPVPVEVKEAFTVRTDAGQKGDADTYEEALEIGRELLADNPEASFFGIAKKFVRVT